MASGGKTDDRQPNPDIGSTDIVKSIRDLRSVFEKGLEKVNSRMDDLEKRSVRDRSTSPSGGMRTESRSPPPKSKRTEPPASRALESQSGRDWADRDDTFRDLPEFHEDEWEDAEDVVDYSVQKRRLSRETDAFLEETFSTTLENVQRKEVRDRYPIPSTPMTRTPKVDDIFALPESKFMKSAEARQMDKDLLQSQGYLLDVVRPLARLLEGTKSEGAMELGEANQAVSDALRLLGNANTQISRLRRKRVLKTCNPDIANLADRTDLFKESAPHLFGEGFELKMKERAEAVSVLQKSSKSYQHPQSRFFRAGRPQRGAGQGYRGNSQRYRGGRSRVPRYNQTDLQRQGEFQRK